MRIGLALQQASERHHCVRIVPTTVRMLYGIFKKRLSVSGHRLVHLRFRGEFQPPCGSQQQTAIIACQISQSLDSASLGKNLPVQPTTIFRGRHKIVFHRFLELLEITGVFRLVVLGLKRDIKRHGRVQRADVGILLH